MSSTAQASAGLPTRHFLQGGWILQILPVCKHIDPGPVLIENGLRRLHRNPMAQVLQHHRVLATTKSTGCLDAWPGMRNPVVKSHFLHHAPCPKECLSTHIMKMSAKHFNLVTLVAKSQILLQWTWLREQNLTQLWQSDDMVFLCCWVRLNEYEHVWLSKLIIQMRTSICPKSCVQCFFYQSH
jgi:hypothetical protein